MCAATEIRVVPSGCNFSAPFEVYSLEVLFMEHIHVLMVQGTIIIAFWCHFSSALQMNASKRRKSLTDDGIQELIFLPGGEISDVDFDSEPHDPNYDPIEEVIYTALCLYEFLTRLENSNILTNSTTVSNFHHLIEGAHKRIWKIKS